MASHSITHLPSSPVLLSGRLLWSGVSVAVPSCIDLLRRRKEVSHQTLSGGMALLFSFANLVQSSCQFEAEDTKEACQLVRELLNPDNDPELIAAFIDIIFNVCTAADSCQNLIVLRFSALHLLRAARSYPSLDGGVGRVAVTAATTRAAGKKQWFPDLQDDRALMQLIKLAASCAAAAENASAEQARNGGHFEQRDLLHATQQHALALIALYCNTNHKLVRRVVMTNVCHQFMTARLPKHWGWPAKADVVHQVDVLYALCASHRLAADWFPRAGYVGAHFASVTRAPQHRFLWSFCPLTFATLCRYRWIARLMALSSPNDELRRSIVFLLRRLERRGAGAVIANMSSPIRLCEWLVDADDSLRGHIVKLLKLLATKHPVQLQLSGCFARMCGVLSLPAAQDVRAVLRHDLKPIIHAIGGASRCTMLLLAEGVQGVTTEAGQRNALFAMVLSQKLRSHLSIDDKDLCAEYQTCIDNHLTAAFAKALQSGEGRSSNQVSPCPPAQHM